MREVRTHATHNRRLFAYTEEDICARIRELGELEKVYALRHYQDRRHFAIATLKEEILKEVGLM